MFTLKHFLKKLLLAFKGKLCIFGRHEFLVTRRLLFLDTDVGEVCKHCEEYGKQLYKPEELDAL